MVGLKLLKLTLNNRQVLLNRLVNIGLRALTVGSRFLLLLALAKILSPTDLGSFGLMLATVLFGVLVLGADFKRYSHRELLARTPDEWPFVIQNHYRAQLLLYAVILPLHLIIFIYGFISWENIVWFYLLLVSVHIALEIEGFLIAMHKQIVASWVFFIQTASWVYIVLPLMYLFPELRSLEVVFTGWIVGAIIASMFGLIAIYQSLPVWERQKMEFAWIKKGLKIGGLFLLASLCFKGLLTFDRYAVEAFGSMEMLGVYVFYISLIMGMFNFLEPAVFSFLYPRMLQHFQSGQIEKYLKVFRELVISTIVLSMALSMAIWIAMPVLISWLDKPVYNEFIDVLPVLISVGFFYAMAFIPHYALYTVKADRWLFLSSFSSLLVFVVSLAFIEKISAIDTVAYSLLLAFIWLAATKTFGLIYLRKQFSVGCIK